MSREIILMLHPAFGVLGILASVWVFAETLSASATNIFRIRTAALLSAGFMWLAYFIGGYWYVVFYADDKALIKAGPWPFAHGLVMESKEHIFLSLLLVATLLPLAAFANLQVRKSARQLVYWSALTVIGLGLAMEGAGAVIGLGAKVALLAQQAG